METKFTKGEWILFGNAPFQEVKCREGDNLMSVNIFYYRNFGVGTEGDLVSDNFSEASVANAKLITAAPELLRVAWNALQTLLAINEIMESNIAPTTTRDLEQAIKKATE